MTKQLEALTAKRLTLIEDRWGNWQPDCGATSDKLREIGVTFGVEGISTAGLDDVLDNVSYHGYWLETVPMEVK